MTEPEHLLAIFYIIEMIAILLTGNILKL
jgi:hypothetical protein